MEEEVHQRREETEVEKTDSIEDTKEIVEHPYNIEEDPEYKYIFVAVKVALVCLAYLSFHMFFNLFIRPLFISLEERIGMVIAALQDQWCHPEGCTPEDEETIQAIIKNIKESGRRFW
ncbi:hypothetical protein WA588_000408 [Blastocystis sp. NMH]